MKAAAFDQKLTYLNEKSESWVLNKDVSYLKLLLLLGSTELLMLASAFNDNGI